MRPVLAAVLLLWIFPAVADDKPNRPVPDFSTVAPENDYRLAKVKDAQRCKVGLLSYYPNKGGGYTFIEREHILFYSLPYVPTKYAIKYVENGEWIDRKGNKQSGSVLKSRRVPIISRREMPLDRQTVYRTEMKEVERPFFHQMDSRRVDTPIAKWWRDAPGDNFQFSIMAENHEIRLRLKSIVPVLEHAEHGR
jgi:hypothetical protein